MEYSPTLCFASFECKRTIPTRKAEKFAKAELSLHNFKMSGYLNRTSRSYVATSNAISQQRIEDELKLEVRMSRHVTSLS